MMNTAAIHEFIGLNPQVRFGKPIVKGTRTTVAEVLEMLANGMSAADIAEARLSGRRRCGLVCCTRLIRKAWCYSR